MAEWFMPFAPPQQQAEEAVTREPVRVRREWDEARFLLCTHCREPIEQGDQCMEFLPGVSGFGPKTGRPAVVDCRQPDYERAVLHIGCIYDYVFQLEESISYQEEPRFCSGCEARLSGDEG